MSCQEKILYLGLDPGNWPKKENLIHYPVIRTERLDTAELQQALSIWPSFSHVVFTSRSAVRHWWEVKSECGKIAIAIGEGTAGELKQRGIAPLVASEAVQEGVIALLERLDLKDAYLFLPRSKKARPALTDYLKAKGIRYFALDLYDTVFQKIEPAPLLREVKEIVFTSPSTVEGFLRIYGSLPKGVRLTPIGPVTEKALEFTLERQPAEQEG